MAPKSPQIAFTWEELKKRKEDGDLLVVFEDNVYNLTKWAHLHPGGELAIKHMAGQDATDVMIAFHPPSTLLRIKPFKIGYIPPSLSKTTQLSLDYRALEKKLWDEGYYNTDYGFYIREIVKFLGLWVGMIYFAAFGMGETWCYVVSCLCGAVLWWQGAFVAHDLGHNGVTHIRKLDKYFGIFIGDFLGGLSVGWWKDNHNTHHIITNDPEHDPDIQHVPFFAISTAFFKNLKSSYYDRVMYFDEFAKRIIPVQHRIFYVVLAFGRFNLYALSVSYLLKRLFTTPVDQNKKPVTARQYREDVVLELVALGLFWGWYGFVLWSLPSWGWVLGYFLVSNMMTGLLHVQITISHFGMPAVTLNGEEFARMGLNSSMDVECPRWLDWFHGGLQFQVIHHLFPRIPRHRLRSIKPMVIKLAQDNGLVYHSHEFVKSNKIVLGVLKEVADQVGFLVEAAPSCLSEGH